MTVFYNKYADLVKDGKTIVFAWIPSHVGIYGNTIVDAAAKSALDDEIEKTRLPFESVRWTDLKRKTSEYVHQQWQIDWNRYTDNKLFKACPDVKKNISMCRVKRKEETILTRLHIGHSYVTHSHLLRGEPPPECVACAETYTIEHILISCADLIDIRSKHYNVDSMKKLWGRPDSPFPNSPFPDSPFPDSPFPNSPYSLLLFHTGAISPYKQTHTHCSIIHSIYFIFNSITSLKFTHALSQTLDGKTIKKRSCDRDDSGAT